MKFKFDSSTRSKIGVMVLFGHLLSNGYNIPKNRKKTRPLGISTVKDHIVQTALKMVLEPIFEKEFLKISYGFRPGRGCKDALREVDRLLKEGHIWVVDADVKSYFDTIPHNLLMDRIREKVSDGKVLNLIELFLKQQIMMECNNLNLYDIKMLSQRTFHFLH